MENEGLNIWIASFGWIIFAWFIVGNIIFNRKVAYKVVKEKYYKLTKRKKIVILRGKPKRSKITKLENVS